MSPDTEYVIDDTHAHAWAEYYQDGVGWLPFEVTPAYIGIMRSAENYQDISGLEGSGALPEVEEETEDEEDTSKDSELDSIDWLLVLQIILIIIICIMLITLLCFLIWVILKRRESRRMKKEFESADTRKAINSLFTYSMNILSVSGLAISNESLYGYEPEIRDMFGGAAAEEYKKAVDIRQESVYSTHEMTREAAGTVAAFKDRMWHRVYDDGNSIQKWQLKYIYFL